MRRLLSFRLFAALFAPWFAVVVAEPVPLHDCPEHSLPPATAHAMASPSGMSGVETPSSGTSHGALEHSGKTHSHDAPGHGAHHQCCCLGACCAVALAPNARAPQLASVAAELRLEPAHTVADSFAPFAAEHVLPFANGPPRRTSLMA